MCFDLVEPYLEFPALMVKGLFALELGGEV